LVASVFIGEIKPRKGERREKKKGGKGGK